MRTRRSESLRPAAIAAIAFLLPASLSSQQKQEKPPAQALVLDALVIDVVTATKTAKKAEDVPAAIEVITARDIQRRGYRHLADVLNDLPDNHEDRGNWGIGEPVNQHSGMGFRFDTGQNLLLLFNGFRLNAFLPGNRFGGEEYLLDDIERIEVLRGPGSALYGAGAFTTVVNVITRTSASVAENALSLEGTGGGAIAGKGSASARIGETGIISGSFRAASDRGQSLVVDNAMFGNAELRDGVPRALTGQLSMAVGGLSVFGNATNQRRRTFTGFNGVNPSDDQNLSLSMYSYFFGAQYVAEPSKRVQLKWSSNWHQDNWTEVALIPMFQLNDEGNGLKRDAQGAPMLDASTVVQRNGTSVNTPFVIDGQGGDTRTVEGEMQLTWNYTRENNIIVGFDLAQDKILKAKRPSEIQLDPFAIVPFQTFSDDANNWLSDTQAARITTAAYGQADYDIGPLSFTLGGRLDRYTGSGLLDQTYTEFNPRGGVVFKQDAIGRLKLLFGSATRVPNGFETLSSVTILGTPANRPERIKTLQALWLRSWSGHVATEFGTFYSRISNHLVTDANISDEMQALGFVGQFRNVPAGELLESQGVNGKLSVRAGRVGTDVNFTRYFNTNDGSGAPLSYIPMSMVNANVNAAFGWVNANVGANYRSTFSQPADDPRPAVKSYVGVNSHFIVQPSSLPWALTVGVRNVLNQDMRAPSSSRDFVRHFPGRAREVSASIRYTF
jgi:outer membrane receptor for ferrienterochelin and colicins